jgi:hypothetical protein
MTSCYDKLHCWQILTTFQNVMVFRVLITGEMQILRSGTSLFSELSLFACLRFACTNMTSKLFMLFKIL